METQDGTSPVSIDTSTEALGAEGGSGPEAVVGETPTQQPTGINPAWAPLREAIGDEFFDAHALPVLKGMDESAHTRITSLNSQLAGFEGYKEFVDQGVNPADLQAALELSQLIESDPQRIYSLLGQHLGVVPAGEEEPEGLEAFGAGQENAAEIPPHIMARLEAAEQFQQQFMEQQALEQQQQQHQQIVEAEGQRLDQEMSAFLTNNPTFTEDDKPELFRMQYELTQQLEARGLRRMATLEEAAAAVNERAAYYRQRGNGNVAPSTLPTTAGGDIPGQQPDVAKMAKQDFVSLIASDLASRPN